MKKISPTAIEFFGDEIERISEIDPLTGKVRNRLEQITIFPGSHHVTPENVRYRRHRDDQSRACKSGSPFFEKENRLVEAQRIQRTDQLRSGNDPGNRLLQRD